MDSPIRSASALSVGSEGGDEEEEDERLGSGGGSSDGFTSYHNKADSFTGDNSYDVTYNDDQGVISFQI